MTTAEPTIDIIREALQRIRSHVAMTPLLTSPELNDRVECHLLLKCENMQFGGAFKSRGACNAVFSLSDHQAARGVCAHSSGNHAIALARAAKLRGISAHIIMPHNSRPSKIESVRRLGVEPIFSGPSPAERQDVTDQVLSRTGATLIHPYDDYRVIAGQATVAMEILEQANLPDVLLVPLGGGGLLAGTLLTMKNQAPTVEVVGVEPAWADDAHRSWTTGTLQQPTRYDTVADGLRTSLGALTFPIIKRLVDDILVCSEETILAATYDLLNVAKLVVEPSGAVALAAIMEHLDRFRNRRVAMILSGGNMIVAEAE